MYCFNFFRNQLWHLISYNSFRNMNMCLLEVAMCEKCRSSHFQSEGGVKSLSTRGGRGGDWVRLLLLGGEVSTSLHDMWLLNIYNDIAQIYEHVTVKDFRKYKKLEYKKNKLKFDIHFLNNCKQLGVSNKDASMSIRKRLLRSAIRTHSIWKLFL